MIRNFWFYTFYSLGDFIKGTLLLVFLHILLFPFYAMGFYFATMPHPDFFLIIVLIGISLINIGVYIRAIVIWRLRAAGKIKPLPYI